jgi:nucleotide-binding universal stress UspA family protein
VAQEIVDQADQGKFDLIVMGHKGRSALRDLLIGSVAQRVLAMAKTPVLLVK